MKYYFTCNTWNCDHIPNHHGTGSRTAAGVTAARAGVPPSTERRRHARQSLSGPEYRGGADRIVSPDSKPEHARRIMASGVRVTESRQVRRSPGPGRSAGPGASRHRTAGCASLDPAELRKSVQYCYEPGQLDLIRRVTVEDGTVTVNPAPPRARGIRSFKLRPGWHCRWRGQTRHAPLSD